MRFLKTILICFLITYAGALRPQEAHKFCGFQEVYEQLKQNPTYLSEQKRIKEARLIGDKSDTVITIPVVVHVIYKNTQENISDAQIYSQLDVLNKDFRKLNSDTAIVVNSLFSVADVKLEFCLAHTDPNGNFTTGITRTFTTEDNIGVNERYYSIKPTWGNTDYLNIWVCDFGLNIAGQGYPPGSPADRDGIVIDYTNFGTIGSVIAPYDKGRTTTHEIGHWLNLFHIWGTNDVNPNCFSDDLVSDTPNQGSTYSGCPLTKFSCNSDDMVNNYMGYVDDRCMVHFSIGQKNRMRTSLINSRLSVVNSDKGCLSIGLDEFKTDFNSKLFPNPSSNWVTLELESETNNFDFTWFNNTGNKINPEQTINNKSIRFQLESFPSGLYFLKIQRGNKFELKKVILNN